MQKITTRKIQRILDANFNRAKEGLRVCEDICRFLRDNERETQKFKKIRHALSAVMGRLMLMALVESRDIKGDVGRSSTQAEFHRENDEDILFANLQRVKESLRVLEECLKLINRRGALNIKRLRYQVYALEKEIVAEL